MNAGMTTLSLSDLSVTDAISLMKIEALVDEAADLGAWPQETPRFARELGHRHHCDPTHAIVFDALRHLFRKRYRSALEASQPTMPTILLPLEDVPDQDEQQAMTPQAIHAWFTRLLDYPRMGPAEPADESTPYLEDILEEG